MNQEIERRRTFAIISHPDAGKTTLTEKFLLFGGQIQVAGAVKNNKIKKTATSDWMDIEKQRGISVSTSVMEFDYTPDGSDIEYKVNILDTPGHQDFAEDTYRTLTAVDSAIIVVDGAKGVETQTRKLMSVCRMRNTPVIIFINKMDREGRDPFDLLDELEKELEIKVRPLSWPINQGAKFKGVYNIYEQKLDLFTPDKQRVTEKVSVEVDSPDLDARVGEQDAEKLREDLELVDGVYPPFDVETYRSAEVAPVFFGSALNNFGVQELLNCFVEIAPSPEAHQGRGAHGAARRTEVYGLHLQDYGQYRPQPPLVHRLLQGVQRQVPAQPALSACASGQDAALLQSHAVHGSAQVDHRRGLAGRHRGSARQRHLQDWRHADRGRAAAFPRTAVVLAGALQIHRERRPHEVETAAERYRPADGRGRGPAVCQPVQRPQDYRHRRSAAVRGHPVSSGERV